MKLPEFSATHALDICAGNTQPPPPQHLWDWQSWWVHLWPCSHLQFEPPGAGRQAETDPHLINTQQNVSCVSSWNDRSNAGVYLWSSPRRRCAECCCCSQTVWATEARVRAHSRRWSVCCNTSASNFPLLLRRDIREVVWVIESHLENEIILSCFFFLPCPSACKKSERKSEYFINIFSIRLHWKSFMWLFKNIGSQMLCTTSSFTFVQLTQLWRWPWTLPYIFPFLWYQTEAHLSDDDLQEIQQDWWPHDVSVCVRIYIKIHKKSLDIELFWNLPKG